MYTVQKKFKFDYAHRLHLMPRGHKCWNLHGHSGVVEISISIPDATFDSNTSGFVVDFGDLQFIKDWIDENWDHGTLVSANDRRLFAIIESLNTKHFVFGVDYNQTSSENMAHVLFRKIEQQIQKGLQLQTISVTMSMTIAIYETENNKAIFSGIIRDVSEVNVK
jgi:6-pyruvoyl tetrahydropterin synthase/QueD family protein